MGLGMEITIRVQPWLRRRSDAQRYCSTMRRIHAVESTLMYWRAWGLLCEFTDMFGAPPVESDGLHPSELARLMTKSLLTGEVAAPLTLALTPARVNEIPTEAVHPRRAPSSKLRKYLDDL